MKANSRETIRDEAVRFVVDAALVVRDPNGPARPTKTGKTVYQFETPALRLCEPNGTFL